MRFHSKIIHVPGKELNTADTLSRAPLNSSNENDYERSQQVDAYVVARDSEQPTGIGRETRTHSKGTGEGSGMYATERVLPRRENQLDRLVEVVLPSENGTHSSKRPPPQRKQSSHP